MDGVWAGKGNLYKRVTYLKEQVFDMGIDVGEGLNWLNSGASRQSDFWLKNMSMAGGRFARSVILPTSREFSKVPRFMTNPKWDIFTQFLRYPTAFSNTVLKNFARDTLNNPGMAGPRFAAFVAGATAIARGTNYWRSSEDQQGRYDRFARKTTDKMSDKVFDAFVARSAEENLRAFQRVGLLGPLEYAVRFGDAYRVNPNPLVALSSLGGPVMGDITGTTIYNRGLFEIIARKTPLIGIRNPLKKYTGLDPYAPIIEGARELDTTTRDALQAGFDSVLPRRNYKKGGVVRDGFQNLGRMRYNKGSEVEVNKYVVEGKTFDKETEIRFNNIDNDLKKLGYSRVARAAILGNIHVETGGTFDHQQKQNNGNGYGLYQFDFQKKFYMENPDSYLKANKFEDNPFNQTMFMHESINQLAPGKHTVNKDMIGQLQRDLQGDDVSTAAVSFSKNYLQPGKPHIERRIDASKTIYEILGD